MHVYSLFSNRFLNNLTSTHALLCWLLSWETCTKKNLTKVTQCQAGPQERAKIWANCVWLIAALIFSAGYYSAPNLFYNSKNLNCIGVLCFFKMCSYIFQWLWRPKWALVVLQVLIVVQLLGWPKFKVKRSFLGVFGLKLVQFFMFFVIFYFD